MITSKHFEEKEFTRLTPSCSLQDMNQGTMNRLDRTRDIANIPLVLTCAYRPSSWDKAKGRSGTGAHTLEKCHAVDIKCNSERNRFKIMSALLEAGFTRIGIAKTYIHADDSPNHTQSVIWLYS
ncbi:D-Ala-D-Ala carboxypeptidase family metallohydrolase [Sunxiuqinia sp. sy24]|uniref:D-Ala-D-Ala carboxypeptidase family metallohydrolase n=1 Tax=Sunxiuqinia sp. sy24 TaxID=3461495 RepID=UPI0040466D60